MPHRIACSRSTHPPRSPCRTSCPPHQKNLNTRYYDKLDTVANTYQVFSVFLLNKKVNFSSLTLINMAPVQGLKSMAPSSKISKLEEDIWVSKDGGIGPIGPRAISLCRTADIPPCTSSVEVIVYNDSWLVQYTGSHSSDTVIEWNSLLKEKDRH